MSPPQLGLLHCSVLSLYHLALQDDETESKSTNQGQAPAWEPLAAVAGCGVLLYKLMGARLAHRGGDREEESTAAWFVWVCVLQGAQLRWSAAAISVAPVLPICHAASAAGSCAAPAEGQGAAWLVLLLTCLRLSCGATLRWRHNGHC